MFRPEFLLLPVLTAIVFLGDYMINVVNSTCTRKRAVEEASWWGGIFFVAGVLDFLPFIDYLM